MPIELKLNREVVNLESLAEQAAAIVGERVPVRYGRGEVHITLPDSTPEAAVSQVRRAVVQHDPDALTETQRALVERRQKLAQARQQLKGADLNPADFDGKDPLIATLARKIAWLEREIAALRDGI